MKMVVGLVVVLVAAFALPSAFASSEIKDVITREAYEKLVNSGAMEGVAMTKTIISNPVLEEALVTYSKNKLGGSILICGETCMMGTCYTPGCSCGGLVCSKNSLQGKNNKAVKDVITRDAYENLVKSGAIEGIAMTKTIVSNPVLEEALVTYSKNKLGGSILICGETCMMGTCYTPGCSCGGLVCSKNSLQGKNNKAVKDVITRDAYENLVKSGAIEGIAMTKTIVSNPVLEEALVTYSKNKLGGSIFNCGETCIMGTCYTPGCSCVYGACSKNSLAAN